MVCFTFWGYAVKKGELAFRKWFGRINEIRSVIGKVPLIALTATATTLTRLKIMQSLEMKKPCLLRESPNRQNISYAVKVVTPDPAKTFHAMLKDLKELKDNYPRTIIYCQTIKVTTFLYGFFHSELGSDMYVDNSMDPKKRTVELFHSRIDILNREHILYSMGIPEGSVRVLIATIAYGMGIDCKDVKVVIHYGSSYNLETYLQESGRAGRNSAEHCRAVMLYSSLMMKHCSEDIKSYAKDSSRCRRKLLLDQQWPDFLNCSSFPSPLHLCFQLSQFINQPSSSSSSSSLLSTPTASSSASSLPSNFTSRVSTPITSSASFTDSFYFVASSIGNGSSSALFSKLSSNRTIP